MKVSATCRGQTDRALVTIVDKPPVQRIHFQVSDVPPRAGWLAENGQKFSAERGFGWLDVNGHSLRDDRARAKSLLLRRLRERAGKAIQAASAGRPLCGPHRHGRRRLRRGPVRALDRTRR